MEDVPPGLIDTGLSVLLQLPELMELPMDLPMDLPMEKLTHMHINITTKIRSLN